MSDYYDDVPNRGGGFFSSLPPYIHAPLIFSIPFIVADFFNYYSAGTALVISLPVLGLIYIICGVLSSKFAADQGRASSELLYIGAFAGLVLWLVSTVVNTIIALILGTATLGTSLLLGIPYLCLCAPLQMVGGGLMGAFGGFLYGLFFGDSIPSDDDFYDY